MSCRKQKGKKEKQKNRKYNNYPKKKEDLNRKYFRLKNPPTILREKHFT
jgi:hypothetical protein